MDDTSPASFNASFSPGFLSANSFGLIGKGTIRIEGGKVVVSGRRRRLFGSGAMRLQFNFADVVNVSRDARVVKFNVPGMPASPAATSAPVRFITACLRDETSAAALHLALGDRQTAEFAASAAEQESYEERLLEVTPSAWVTPTLVALNVIVFALMVLAGAGFFVPNPEVLVRWGSNFGERTTTGEWWRLLTATFLHFGVLHLAFNMFALQMTGKLVERLYGNVTYLLIYVASGLAGSIASLLWHPHVNSAGASGAIFGVFGALLAFMLYKREGMPAELVRKQRLSTILFLINSLVPGATSPLIDNAAHLGGLAAGFVLGLAMARPLEAAARGTFPRRGFAAYAVALIGLACATLPLHKVGADMRQERAFMEAVADFDAMTLRTEESRKAIFIAISGTNSRADTAGHVLREVVQPYRDSLVRLAAPLPEKARLRDFQVELVRMVNERIAGFESIAEGIRLDDVAKVEAGSRRIQDSAKAFQDFADARKARP